MNYEEAVAYLDETPKFTKKNSLDHTKECLKRLGNPQDKFRVIHVAGTNGKGSTCAFITSILREAGYSCGLFTSPHLVEINERFQINEKNIDNDTFLKMLNNNEIIEYRKKELNNKIIYYGTPFKSIDVDSDNNYLKPLDETGVMALKKYLGEENVTAIYLECDKRIRMKRAKNREPNIDMNLLLKRFNDDKNTVETFKNHCDLVFKNESKEDLR